MDNTPKPSDISMGKGAATNPLLNTLGKAEWEWAAVFLILACVDNGDTWSPVSWERVRAAVLKREKEPFWAGMIDNRFVRPDFRGLAYSKFGIRIDASQSTRFTPSGGLLVENIPEQFGLSPLAIDRIAAKYGPGKEGA